MDPHGLAADTCNAQGKQCHSENSDTWGRLQKNCLNAGPHIPNLYFQVDVLSGHKSHLSLKAHLSSGQTKKRIESILAANPILTKCRGYSQSSHLCILTNYKNSDT